MRALAAALLLFVTACATPGSIDVAKPCTVDGAYKTGLIGQPFPGCAGAAEVAAAHEKGLNYGALSREIIRLERLAFDIRDGRISRLGFKSHTITPFGCVSAARRALIAIDDADRLEALNDLRGRIRYLRTLREVYAL